MAFFRLLFLLDYRDRSIRCTFCPFVAYRNLARISFGRVACERCRGFWNSSDSHFLPSVCPSSRLKSDVWIVYGLLDVEIDSFHCGSLLLSRPTLASMKRGTSIPSETRRQGGMEAPHSSEHRGILLLSRVLIDPDDKETLQKNGP